MPREKDWPGWTVHDALTARHRHAIARALSGLLPDREAAAERILTSLQSAGHDGGDLRLSLVLSDLQGLAVPPDPETLHPLVIDGYAAGVRQAQRDVHAFQKADQSGGLMGIDWSSWEPGDLDLANALLSGVDDATVLASLLSDAGVTIKSVAANRLGEVARVIADGIGTGSTTRDVTGLIAQVLDNPDRAEMVSRTETTRVMVGGAMDTYRDAGVGYVLVLSAEDTGVCTLCQENEEAGALPLWDQPPNGWPPSHPNCRCTVLPANGPNG
jgi:SPP1 gp7 family putative phage head morphogenesis protein